MDALELTQVFGRDRMLHGCPLRVRGWRPIMEPQADFSFCSDQDRHVASVLERDEGWTYSGWSKNSSMVTVAVVAPVFQVCIAQQRKHLSRFKHHHVQALQGSLLCGSMKSNNQHIPADSDFSRSKGLCVRAMGMNVDTRELIKHLAVNRGSTGRPYVGACRPRCPKEISASVMVKIVKRPRYLND